MVSVPNVPIKLLSSAMFCEMYHSEPTLSPVGPGTLSIQAGDSPSEPLTDPVGGSFSRYERNDTFSTYLMFQPSLAGSIPVPLRRTDWYWNGIALVANQSWTVDLGISTFSRDPSSVDPVSSTPSSSAWPNWERYIFSEIPLWRDRQ